MIETEVVLYEEVNDIKLSNATLIEGLPGVGLVAKAAVAYLVDKLKPVRIARFYSPHFHSVGYIQEGRIVLSFADLYVAELPKPLILLYGNAQPSSSVGQHDFCEKVLDLSQRIGASFMVTLGGWSKDEVSPERGIYCSSTNMEKINERVRRVGGRFFAGHIAGAAGLLVTMAGERGMDNFSMLVETKDIAPDFYAARRAAEGVIKLLDLSIDLGSVEDFSKSYRSVLVNYET